MRCWIALLAIILVAVASCGVQHQATPRQPVPLAEVSRSDVGFEAIALAEVEACNSRNAQAVRALFTKDAVAHDKIVGDHAVGTNQIAGLIAIVSGFGPSWEARVTDRCIGLEDELAVDELWNLRLGGSEFTQDHPLLEVDWLRTRDNRISYWTLFYGLDTMEELGVATPQRLDQARSLLSSY